MSDPYPRITDWSGDTNAKLEKLEASLSAWAKTQIDASGGGGGGADLDLFYQATMLDRRRQFDQIRSRDLAIVDRDALTWNDQLADLNSPWETAGSPVVSGGKAYGTTTPSTISVALRPITFTNRFRFLCPVDFKTGTGTNRLSGIVATTSSAATLSTGSMTNSVSVAIDATAAGGRMAFANAFGINELWSALPDTSKQYLMGMFWDDVRGLGVFIRSIDGTFEKASYVANSLMTGLPWKPTKIGFFSADNRGSASATGYGPFGFRASHANIEPRTGVEGIEHAVHYGGLTPPPDAEKSRVMVPQTYDSRVGAPLAIFCHGGGSDVAQAYIADSFLDSGYIVAAGDFRDTQNSLYAFGHPESINRVAALYRWVRDHYNIGPVVLTGYSMGGMTCVRVIEDGRVPAVAAAFGNPALDLHWVWTVRANPMVSPVWSTIKAAWGVPNDSESAWNTATSAYNPMTMDPTRFRGVPMFIVSSPSDTDAVETENALPFIDRLETVSSPVIHYPATGGHGDPSGYPAAQMLSFFNSVLYS